MSVASRRSPTIVPEWRKSETQHVYQDIQKAVADANVPAVEIQRLAAAVRSHQREKDAALKTARERLREVLTARQEAVLLLYGILD